MSLEVYQAKDVVSHSWDIGHKMLQQMKCLNIQQVYDELGNFKMSGEIKHPHSHGYMTIVTTLTFSSHGNLIDTDLFGIDEEGRISDFRNLVTGKNLN